MYDTLEHVHEQVHVCKNVLYVQQRNNFDLG
jgi:hypothetical protein